MVVILTHLFEAPLHHLLSYVLFSMLESLCACFASFLSFASVLLFFVILCGNFTSFWCCFVTLSQSFDTSLLLFCNDISTLWSHFTCLLSCSLHLFFGFSCLLFTSICNLFVYFVCLCCLFFVSLHPIQLWSLLIFVFSCASMVLDYMYFFQL